ncbi:flagellar basal body rod protein FlgB [Geotalea uraniireducens]|uniref:Flagellar basal body rod protein FlgB n=1 Tax=Geotalea uraniireducens TaxID=351604 RepID=A0ABN6VTU2_9BACT|nr:flagellar basal body rod protein FlgB [Geotalea uraniireducens]BDV41445.1 flagellar basal body rod protein FlgB [Geotalea uraniireducens]
MPIDGLFNTTIQVLAKSIDMRAKNHTMLSANLANAETPNYTPSVLSFEDELKSALKGKHGGTPALTNPRHIPLKGNSSSIQSVQGEVVNIASSDTGKDNNGVVLETEMTQLAENQIMYNASVQMLENKFTDLKYAITGSK